MLHDIKLPDNEADTVITITISGNALVSLLNMAECLAKDYRREHPTQNWYRQQLCTIEQLREALSTQRCAVYFAGRYFHGGWTS